MVSRVELDMTKLRVARAILPAYVASAVQQTNTAVYNRWRSGVAVDTGAYRSSLEEFSRGNLELGVRTGVDYDYAQEYGRPDLPNYRYTPAARPAAEAERPKHKQRVKAALKRAME